MHFDWLDVILHMTVCGIQSTDLYRYSLIAKIIVRHLVDASIARADICNQSLVTIQHRNVAFCVNVHDNLVSLLNVTAQHSLCKSIF